MVMHSILPGEQRALDKRVIFILGLSRSGTSALTRVLSLCGCVLPQSVLGDGDLNPTGVWEPVDAVILNREFLFRHDVSFGDPTLRLQEEIVIDQSEKEGYVKQIQTFLDQCPNEPMLVLKEPSITDVAPFWFEAARRNGFLANVVIAFRHPGQVFASMSTLAKGGQVSQERVNAWWLKENLLAERHSRSLSRVFVEYSNLMKDWRVEVARVSQALSVDLQAQEAAIDEFLTPDLHRHRYAGPVSETFGNSWISTIYAAFSAAAQDGLPDIQSLDDVYGAYRASERAFRIAWQEFRKTSAPQQADQLREWLERWPTWKSGRDF